MSSTQLTTVPMQEATRADESRILALKLELESPAQGVAAAALAELRRVAPEGLPEALAERLKATPPRFFLPVSKREEREIQSTRERRLELLRAMTAEPAVEFVPLLVGLAGDWDAVVSSAAISGLRELPGEAARSALATLVAHRDRRVRREATAALAHRKEPECLPLFLRLLKERDRETQRQAVLGLGQIDSKEAREALAEQFRWAVDTGSPALTRWINVLLPAALVGIGAWAHFAPSIEWTVPQLCFLLLSGVYVVARQRRKVDRRYLAQSLAEQSKARVPDEIVTLLPEMEAVETGFWQSDEQTIGAVSRISQAAKAQIEERGNLPVAVESAAETDVQDLPLASSPPD